jgi:hypothetical protein
MAIQMKKVKQNYNNGLNVNQSQGIKQKVKQIVKHSYLRTLAFQAEDRDSISLGGTKPF